MSAPRTTIRDGARAMLSILEREGRVDVDSHGHIQPLSGEEAVRAGRALIAAGEAVIAERAARKPARSKTGALA